MKRSRQDYCIRKAKAHVKELPILKSKTRQQVALASVSPGDEVHEDTKDLPQVLYTLKLCLCHPQIGTPPVP